MRRSRQQLDQAQCIEILNRCTSGTLALLGDGGYPYALPISFVYADGVIYFHSALHGHKIDAIAHCDKASFAVIDRDEVHPGEYTTYFRSVIGFGRINVISDPEQKLQVLHLLGQRYNPGHPADLEAEIAHAGKAACVIALRIEYLTGKQSIELAKKQ